MSYKIFKMHWEANKLEAITFENMSEKLVEKFPELRPRYEEECKWWEDEVPGQHIIYGDILNPYIVSLLESDEQGSSEHEATLKRIFAFLEELVNHEDEDIQGVVVTTVLEYLDSPKVQLEKARKYMGETTLGYSHDVEAAFWKDPSSRS